MTTTTVAPMTNFVRLTAALLRPLATHEFLEGPSADLDGFLGDVRETLAGFEALRETLRGPIEIGGEEVVAAGHNLVALLAATAPAMKLEEAATRTLLANLLWFFYVSLDITAGRRTTPEPAHA